MKRGIATTEFWVNVAVAGAAWTTTALALLDELPEDAIPEKYQPALLLTTLLLTAFQSAFYTVSRARVKESENMVQAAMQHHQAASLLVEAQTAQAAAKKPVRKSTKKATTKRRAST